MSKIKCEKCGASWDTENNKACPYCGSARVEKTKHQEARESGGTTIINNYYGNVPQGATQSTSSAINERGEPIGLSEKELKIYYQPRPRVLWLAVLCFAICVAIIGFVAEEILDFEEVWVAVVAVCAIIVPITIYLIIIKCKQSRWDKLHSRARKLRENGEKFE